MKKNKLVIRQPQTPKEFEQYYHLRWKILREPWQQPSGSEKDKKENEAIHLTAFLDGKLIGCGRGHLLSDTKAQIRYMAVDNAFRQQGIGTKLLQELEKELAKKNAQEIILQARKKAIHFYQKHGYTIFQKGDFLFGEIEHFWLKKYLEK